MKIIDEIQLPKAVTKNFHLTVSSEELIVLRFALNAKDLVERIWEPGDNQKTNPNWDSITEIQKLVADIGNGLQKVKVGSTKRIPRDANGEEIEE